MKLLVIFFTFLFYINCNATYLTLSDIKRFNSEQLEVLNMSYMVGNYYSNEPNMGFWLAANAIVENSGYMKDSNKNHICGPHQINIKYNDIECKTLESNPFISSIVALENLKYWKYAKNSKGKIIHERGIEKRIRMYNVGYSNDSFQWIHIKKIKESYKALIKYKDYWKD